MNKDLKKFLKIFLIVIGVIILTLVVIIGIIIGIGISLQNYAENYDPYSSSNIDSIISNDPRCSIFCDSTGYEPSWVSSMNAGPNQIEAKCDNNYYQGDWRGTKDGDWCNEFQGYNRDNFLGRDLPPRNDPRCSIFCDSTGYEPSWASSMKNIGPEQLEAKCYNNSGDWRGTKDGDWCREFNGYYYDSLGIG